MKVEVETNDLPLLELMNRHKYPDVKVGVYVVQGRHGELYITCRSVEAFVRWAETNGYDNWALFCNDFADKIEWSDNGRSGFLDDGGSIEYMPVEGYYRDGGEHL